VCLTTEQQAALRERIAAFCHRESVKV